MQERPLSWQSQVPALQKKLQQSLFNVHEEPCGAHVPQVPPAGQNPSWQHGLTMEQLSPGAAQKAHVPAWLQNWEQHSEEVLHMAAPPLQLGPHMPGVPPPPHWEGGTHVPQSPPQPSEPQFLPPQAGTQPLLVLVVLEDVELAAVLVVEEEDEELVPPVPVALVDDEELVPPVPVALVDDEELVPPMPVALVDDEELAPPAPVVLLEVEVVLPPDPHATGASASSTSQM